MLSKVLLGVATLLCFSSSQAGDWKRHQVMIKNFKSQIVSFQRSLDQLIERKKSATDQQTERKIMQQMVITHAQLVKAHQRYREEYDHMRFRHPERGEEFEKTYSEQVKLKDLEEIDEEAGIEGRLTKIRRTLQKHFGVDVEQEEEKKRKYPRTFATPPPSEEGRIKLTK